MVLTLLVVNMIQATLIKTNAKLDATGVLRLPLSKGVARDHVRT